MGNVPSRSVRLAGWRRRLGAAASVISQNDQMPVPPPIGGSLPARTALSVLFAAPCP